VNNQGTGDGIQEILAIKPILLIAFNRPEKTRQLVHELLQYKQFRIYIAVDAPRTYADEHKCKIVLAELEKLKTLHWVTIRVNENNLGCGRNIHDALKWFLSLEVCGIIIEDDIQLMPGFFEYMTNALEMHAINSDIGCISSSAYLSAGNGDNSFLSKYPNIWGWGLWRRSLEGYKLVYSNKEIIRYAFMLFDKQKRLLEPIYWALAVKLCSTRRIDTWDIQLYINLMSKGLNCLVPAEPFSCNIGFDEEATHTKKTPDYYIKHQEYIHNNSCLRASSSATKSPSPAPDYDKLVKYQIFKINIITIIKLLVKLLTTSSSSYWLSETK
jgi:hypothetical protein